MVAIPVRYIDGKDVRLITRPMEGQPSSMLRPAVGVGPRRQVGG